MPRFLAEKALLESFHLYSRPCKEITSIVSGACKLFPALGACDTGIEDRHGVYDIASAKAGVEAGECKTAAKVVLESASPCEAQCLQVGQDIEQLLEYFKNAQ